MMIRRRGGPRLALATLFVALAPVVATACGSSGDSGGSADASTTAVADASGAESTGADGTAPSGTMPDESAMTTAMGLAEVLSHASTAKESLASDKAKATQEAQEMQTKWDSLSPKVKEKNAAAHARLDAAVKQVKAAVPAGQASQIDAALNEMQAAMTSMLEQQPAS